MGEVWKVARERCFGKLEGQGVDNMLQEVKGKNKDQLFAWGPEDGETGSQFRDRVRQFVKDLGKRVIKCKENESLTRVLVTTHGGFIKDFNMVMVNGGGSAPTRGCPPTTWYWMRMGSCCRRWCAL